MTNLLSSKKGYGLHRCETQPTDISGRKEKGFNSTFGEVMRGQEVEKPSTTGGKFKRILTEMKDQVKEIKLEKMRVF